MHVLKLITPGNVLTFKAIRLQALQDSPTAFGSTYARESQLSDAEWQSRAAECDCKTSVGYLAIDAETACGIARATPDEQDASVAWLESMWVAPTHRRLGVGRLLVEAILAWASDRGLRILKLHVTSNNELAIRFYERLGFISTGNSVPYPNDPAFVEYEMSRALP